MRDPMLVLAERTYADPVQRLYASLIDSLYTFLLPGALLMYASTSPHPLLLSLGFILFLLWPIIYTTYYLGKYGQTIGQRRMKITTLVISNQGRKGIGYLRALSRTLIGFVSTIIAHIGDVAMLVSEFRQTFQDKACSTIVVNESMVAEAKKMRKAKKRWIDAIIIEGAFVLLLFYVIQHS